MTLGNAGMDPSVAIVAPSVGEGGEMAEIDVDVVEPLVSSTSSMLGSPAVDNKLRFTTSIEGASAPVVIAKVTFVILLTVLYVRPSVAL